MYANKEITHFSHKCWKCPFKTHLLTDKSILQMKLNIIMCIFMFNFHYRYQISKALYIYVTKRKEKLHLREG